MPIAEGFAGQSHGVANATASKVWVNLHDVTTCNRKGHFTAFAESLIRGYKPGDGFLKVLVS